MPYKDREARNAYQRQYYQLHKDETANRRRARDAKNHAAQRARRGDEINARRRERYAAVPEVRERKSMQGSSYRARNPDKIHERNRVNYVRDGGVTGRNHKMRPEDRAAMYQAQAGRCYLCGEPLETEPKIVIEHDHTCCPTNQSCPICRRGLAHHKCNVAIGLANDDPIRLRRMADALEAAQQGVAERMTAAAQQLNLELEA